VAIDPAAARTVAPGSSMAEGYGSGRSPTVWLHRCLEIGQGHRGEAPVLEPDEGHPGRDPRLGGMQVVHQRHQDATPTLERAPVRDHPLTHASERAAPGERRRVVDVEEAIGSEEARHPAGVQTEKSGQARQRLILAGIVVGALAGLAGLGYALVWLGRNPGPAENIRDVAIILAAAVMVLVLVALSVLIVQLARLMYLLQHEIRPILASTSETVNTVRGTAEFLGNNLVEPVVKLSSYLAALQRLLSLLKLGDLIGK